MKRCVILVGHGGVPKDCPSALVSDFKRLEASLGALSDSPLLAEADRKLRLWPRTSKTDPYKDGLERIAESLRRRFSDRIVLEAYNEFCAPSLPAALQRALDEGCREVSVISTMFTRGGVHSEFEIPAILDAFLKKHPQVSLNYVWPFALEAGSNFLAAEVLRTETGAAAH